MASRSDDGEGSFSGKRPRPLSQALPGLPALPKGEPLAKPQALRGNRELYLYAQASPFEERLPPRRGKMSRSDKRGSVDLQSKDGEGEDANPSAALSQKAALQLPFAVATPPVKIAFGAARRPRQTRNYK